MDIKILKRLIYRLFPELTGKWHLSHLAKIVSYPELPEEGELSDRYYPRYAANIALLDEKMVVREDVPELQAVPLPINFVGNMAGRLEPSAIGTIVEVVFALGQPDMPFIRTILPLGHKLPAIKEGESKYQQRPGVYDFWDVKGNHHRQSDQGEEIEFLKQKIKILEDRIEEIGGTKSTKAEKIIEEAQVIMMNGKSGQVVTTQCVCHFTGLPHNDGSNSVFAGK